MCAQFLHLYMFAPVVSVIFCFLNSLLNHRAPFGTRVRPPVAVELGLAMFIYSQHIFQSTILSFDFVSKCTVFFLFLFALLPHYFIKIEEETPTLAQVLLKGNEAITKMMGGEKGAALPLVRK